MNNKPSQVRLKAVRYYLKNGVSLRRTALKFHIAYRTLFTWVKLYKEQGEERLLSTYKRPWNRTERALEERIVLMKEHEPSLTVRKAQEYLEKDGIRISIKGIWGIWKRYGYAGFDKKNMRYLWTNCAWTKEAKRKFERAEELFSLGAIEKSADILNSIPSLPENDLLLQIPDSLLHIRRRQEKIELLYGEIPVVSYLKKVRNLYEECEQRNLYYSALGLGFTEVSALSWRGKPMMMLQKIEELKDMLKKTGNYFSYLLFDLRLSLLTLEGSAYAALYKIKEAKEIAKICSKLLKNRKYIALVCMYQLGILYQTLHDITRAEYWYLRLLDGLDGEEKEIGKYSLAHIFIWKGEYKKAMHIFKNKNLSVWSHRSTELYAQAIWSLVTGMPDKAISLSTEALSLARTEEVLGYLPALSFTITCAYWSLGEKTKAKSILKRILPILVKNKLKHDEIITEILLSQTLKNKYSPRLSDVHLPTIKLLLLLKNGHYWKSFRYAKKKGIVSYFHRYIFFFPEAIMPLLEKGKPTGLPRAMLNLPVFRKEIPVYFVKFLGNLIIYKNQKYLRVRLAPKDTAFLIHLATLRKRHLSLDRIYNNFWPDSSNPSRNLADLLVKLRKALCLPSHFLHIKENSLRVDCHIITDYGEYLDHLARAKAFERAHEWEFARNEYLHAFSLFRGEPFIKMYDRWSDDMRRAILNQLENTALHFIKFCSAHRDGRDAKKVLQKVSKILPYSDEIKHVLSNLVIS